MSGFSTYFAQQIINEKFVSGATKYVALFLADPTDNNVTANEVPGAWYARQSVSAWSAPTGTGKSTSNAAEFKFYAVTGNAITATHWGVYDALTGGNLIASAAILNSNGDVAPKVLDVDSVFVVGAGELVLNFR